jgi:3-oxoacyl-[acyl-carrier-protein] synthase-1
MTIQPLAITATSLVSAIGRGGAATLSALRERRGGLRPCDFGDIGPSGYIGRILELEAHALPAALARFDCRNNRLADIALATDGFADAVATARRRYGADRIAVILGTSTSGIQAGEDAYRRRDPATGALPADFDFEHSYDIFSLARFVRTALGLHGPASVISTACASSALSFADAHQLIACDVVDAAVVGGVDSLCRMTLRGFAALDLISPQPCRPCDAARSGISLGEAGGFALLERADAAPDSSLFLFGYGVTSDGYHMSSPHPHGAGAIGAMREALRRAGLAPDAIDYVNLHGTATRANDAVEDMAVSEVFGTATPCSSTKGWTGHTLGAAGIVEAVISTLCITHGFTPGGMNLTEVDPGFSAAVLTENRSLPVRRVVSNSFGFGGINCSLVLGAPA